MNKKNLETDLINKLKTYLSYRAHSEYELKCKLIKSFDEQAVLRALKLAKQNKLLPSPEEMAQQLANEWHRKKKGWLFIQATLKKKQLPAIAKQEQKEEEKCRWWLSKKFSNIKNPSKERIQKIYRFLSYRGFEKQVIKKTVYEETSKINKYHSS